MKTFFKLAAVAAATTMLLSPGVSALAEDQAAAPLLGTPSAQWITVNDLTSSADYKALLAAERKTLKAIAKSKNFDIKISETLATTSSVSGNLSVSFSLQGNKTRGHSQQRTTGTGALKGQSSLIDCTYTNGKYYVPLNSKTALRQVTLKEALASIKARSAKRYYDSNGYAFDMQPQACFSDPKPANLLAAVTSTTPGGISSIGLVGSIVLSPNNRVQPISVVKATGSKKSNVYTITGQSQNEENPENVISFVATLYVDAKTASLTKLTVKMDEPGMGFNVNLTYEYLKTSAVTVSVATDHAVSGVALDRAFHQISVNSLALTQAKDVASAANVSSKVTHKKVSATSLAATAKAKHYVVSKNSAGVKISFVENYLAPANAKKTTKVTGHACVNIVKSRAVAKACK